MCYNSSDVYKNIFLKYVQIYSIAVLNPSFTDINTETYFSAFSEKT